MVIIECCCLCLCSTIIEVHPLRCKENSKYFSREHRRCCWIFHKAAKSCTNSQPINTTLKNHITTEISICTTHIHVLKNLQNLFDVSKHAFLLQTYSWWYMLTPQLIMMIKVIIHVVASCLGLKSIMRLTLLAQNWGIYLIS